MFPYYCFLFINIIMARELDYYHPVVDLISSEEKRELIKIFDDIDEFRYLQAEDSVDRKANNKISADLDDGDAKFTETYFDKYPLCWELVERYQGSIWTFLHVKAGRGIWRHADYKETRKCCITFPLYPDYAEYANTNFYDDTIQTESSAYLNYGLVRSPALINVNKFHAVEESSVDRLAFQIQFLPEFDFKDVRSQLQARKLLSTPV